MGKTPFGYGIQLPVNKVGNFSASIWKDDHKLDPSTSGLTTSWSSEGLINHFVKDINLPDLHYKQETASYEFTQPGVKAIKCCATYSNDTYCSSMQIEVTS